MGVRLEVTGGRGPRNYVFRMVICVSRLGGCVCGVVRIGGSFLFVVGSSRVFRPSVSFVFHEASFFIFLLGFYHLYRVSLFIFINKFVFPCGVSVF